MGLSAGIFPDLKTLPSSQNGFYCIEECHTYRKRVWRDLLRHLWSQFHNIYTMVNRVLMFGHRSQHLHNDKNSKKQAARLILNEQMNKEKHNSIYSPYSKTLDWQTFEENVKYRQALLVYKALNNGAPGYMKDMFNYIHQISTQTLRSSTENKTLLAESPHQKA